MFPSSLCLFTAFHRAHRFWLCILLPFLWCCPFFAWKTKLPWLFLPLFSIGGLTFNVYAVCGQISPFSLPLWISVCLVVSSSLHMSMCPCWSSLLLGPLVDRYFWSSQHLNALVGHFGYLSTPRLLCIALKFPARSFRISRDRGCSGWIPPTLTQMAKGKVVWPLSIGASRGSTFSLSSMWVV